MAGAQLPASGQMSARERILAALNRQAVDRIPFVPLFDPYTLMDLPREITGDESLSVFHPRRMIAALTALGCDSMVRNVLAATMFEGGARQLQSLGSFAPPVETRTDLKGDELTETVVTPVGTLRGVWKFTDRVGTIPHFTQYVVNNYEEMKIYHYALEHLDIDAAQPRYESFLKIDQFLGDEGVPTASIHNSPFMFLIEFVFGLENTYFMLHEHREAVEDILEKLHASQRRYVEILADSPAKIIIQYENTSSTLLTANALRRYCLPYLNDYANILQSAGKVYLIHMCGKLRAFTDDIGQAHFTGVCDVAPSPTGDLPLDEAAAKMPGKVVVGGIDGTTFVSQDKEFVKNEVSGLIERIKPFPGVLLGSGDVTPRGTPVENFCLIRHLVDTLGAYT